MHMSKYPIQFAWNWGTTC